MTQYLFYYLAVVNFVTFIIFVSDKQQAIYNQQRVPEKFLWLMALIGGSLGGIMAMEIVRHKRRKIDFSLVMYTILLLQAMAIYCWAHYFKK
jgi:uncharacterized membrane protein YsdA (DUF1294 family)